MDRANGGGPGAAAAANRAERFEDEKRRIIESCFNKKDVDGSRKSCYCVVKLGFICRSSELNGLEMALKLGDWNSLYSIQQTDRLGQFSKPTLPISESPNTAPILRPLLHLKRGQLKIRNLE